MAAKCDVIEQLRQRVAELEDALREAKDALDSTGHNDDMQGETQFFDDAKVEDAIAKINEVLKETK